MKKSINAQLKMLSALRDQPRFGYRTPEFEEAEKAKLMAAIGHEPSALPVRYGVMDYLEYYKATLGPLMMRSMAGATAGVAILLGGWLTTVSAATNSLPGDSLYGLKLITEQVQLRVSSLEARAVLHTEFAERRLQEAVALHQTGDANADEVREAFDSFTREVSSANSDLKSLQESGSAVAVETAGKVEQKLASLDAVLEQSVIAVGTTVATEVAQEAKEVSRDAQTAAVTVVVDSHESTETQASTQELQQMFMRQLGDLQARQAFDVRRVDMIRTAKSSDDPRLAALTLPTSSELAVIEKIVKGEGARINDALTAYSLADFRTAFDLLQAIDRTLQTQEYVMAEVEIAITQAFTQPVAPEAPNDAADATVNSDTATATE